MTTTILEKGQTIEVEAFANAAPETVFETLSDPAQLAQLMSCKISGDMRDGSPIRFDWEMSPEQEAEEDCCGVCGGEIIAVEPPKRLAFSWGHEAEGVGVDWGASLVEFLVTPEGAGSRITIRHSGLPNEKEAGNHHGGWTEYAEVMAEHFA